MDKFVEAVVDFNVNLLGIEPRPLSPMSDNEVNHIIKALKEELDDLADGHGNQDVVDCVDAFIDIIYWSIGGLHKLGLTSDQILRCCHIVHECNMEKKKGSVASRATDGVADAIKPEDWVGPEERMAKFLLNV